MTDVRFYDNVDDALLMSAVIISKAKGSYMRRPEH